MTAKECSDFIQHELIALDICTTDIDWLEEVEGVRKEGSTAESGFTSHDEWIVCPHHIPWIISHPLFINESPESNSSYSLDQKTIPQPYILTLKLLPLIQDASQSGRDDSLSAMSLQWLPVRGHSIWMLQFRPLTLVRSTQFLPCLIQGQQVSSLIQSSCDTITWPGNHWHGLFLCRVGDIYFQHLIT